MAIDQNELTHTAVPADGERRFSRRRVFQAAGAGAGLVVAWSALGGRASAADATPTAAATPKPAAQSGPPTTLDSYLTVNKDGTVTLATGKVEFGQGIRTGFMMLVAEELGLEIGSVSVIMGITDKTPWDLGTFGSLSTQLTGPRIRQAAATMRAWLAELGADYLKVTPADVIVSAGFVALTNDGMKRVAIGDLAAGKPSMRDLDPKAPLKDPSQFKILGTSVPRVDIGEKVNGSLKYGIDAHLDGMVYGKIVRPAAISAPLVSIDFSEAEKVTGFVGSFRDGDFAGIAAERIEQVELALSKVNATWGDVTTGNTSENIFDLLKKTAGKGSPIGVEKPKDPNATPVAIEDPTSNLTNPVKLSFSAPYVNHGPIEPRNALVEITPNKVNVWTSTQDPFTAQSSVAKALGVDPATVVVDPMNSGGAFGSKIAPMAAVEAARLAKGVGRPVKLIWRREEEFGHGQYRPAMLVEITTGLGPDNKIAGWKYDLYASAYFPETAEKPTGAAADWSSNIKEVYDVEAAHTTLYQGQSPLNPYFWRVNGAATNTMAREITIDTLAEQAGQNPVTFRKNHLENKPRMLAVLEAVVKKANWTPGVGSTGQGFGVALGFDGNSYVAELAQVKVDDKTGVITVVHFDAAIDCGLAVNLQGITDQVEGAIVLSLSPAMKEAIRFKDGVVLTQTWDSYNPLRMKEVPTVDVVVVQNLNEKMGGVGEPGVAPVPGAVSNAVYDAIGIRLHDMPFTPDKVLAALKAKSEGGSATPTA